jgi:uncharacterized membrane protein YhiD involved in acid resistance
MHDSLEQLLGFGTIFGGLVGLIPFSIARHQGRRQYAVVALAACIISGSAIGPKLALPVFTSLTVMALTTAKSNEL